MNALVPAAEVSQRANGLAHIRAVQDAVPVLDTARFEHMQRIATVMAQSSLTPDALTKGAAPNVALANCFLVVNQAVRWGMDPFAVAQCVSVIKGKLCYEGKLVAAVLEAKLGVRLKYTWSGAGDAMKVVVTGQLPDGTTETIEGTVSEWRTTGTGSPWSPANYRRMLAYRGAREWARMFAPAVMLGVYAEDEMEDLRAARARDITPPSPPVPPSAPPSPPAPPARQIEQGPSAASPAGGPPPAPPAARTQAGPPSPPPAPPPTPPAPPPAPAGSSHPASLADSDPDAALDYIGEELGACGDVETLQEAWGSLEEMIGRLPRDHRNRAETAFEQHAKRMRESTPAK